MTAEAAFIEAMRTLACSDAARGLNDDAAVLQADGPLVVTHDIMVEGVHWLPGQDAADVAWKLVATNLSDLAAKGCAPVGLVLGYMLGDTAWNARFVLGLRDVLQRFDAPLIGGDTVSQASAGPRSLGLTAIGRPARNPPPARADAAAGQRVWVTGILGAALAGFEALQAGNNDPDLTAPYRRPVPLISQGIALAPVVGGMMDVSDGLLLDAGRMAIASGTTLAIDSAAVPVHAALADRRMEGMTWGDDYQLLFTLDPQLHAPVAATCIGRVLPRGPVPLLIDGAAPDAAMQLGFLHEGTSAALNRDK
ncbi:thiamine-phosphate kinase [Croceicoccus sp. F390]|uniref:Thiamine-monophosphate kinase n=1 Tax=Croceicoccus esteveae TaxID=3075597 RepID=A0ABU2ZG63_9SPHN|nr:thiamine-phosphate kinase [Croceicoccus sp. F390]MDT0575588.1 thiamine-phosphate kinase [Croceicoccus sp. F390]